MGHVEDINASFDEFEHALRDTLANRDNPLHRPDERVLSLLNLAPGEPPEALWQALTETIEALKPAAAPPANPRGWRYYEVLALRYVQGQTQEETADRLGITPRHLRREQQNAVRLLAQRLWDRAGSAGKRAAAAPDWVTAAHEASDWQAQMRSELASLQRSVPGAVSSAAETTQRAIELARGLLNSHQASVTIAEMPASALVELHPSALTQIIIGVLEALLTPAGGEQIRISAEAVDHYTRLVFERQSFGAAPLKVSDHVRAIVEAEGGLLRILPLRAGARIELELPTAQERTVLVVDDNLDLVHFYRRYVANTRYRIEHLEDGANLLPAAERLQPDIIVLDVMLPDGDGWELLGSLRQSAITRAIPIIVCSVIKAKDLAVSLGAALYVPKPVGRRQFLEALDQVSRGLQQQL